MGQIYDENGKKIPDTSTAPAWIYKDHPDSVMKNFSADYQWQLDFTDDIIQKKSTEFIEKTVHHFSNRYPGKILGFAVGLQEEHEIKYGQTGYQWRDYNDRTQLDFKQKYGEKQPVINYNNEIKNGLANAEPLLYAHKEYRENRLKDATCAYAKAIRDQGALAMGYFDDFAVFEEKIYVLDGNKRKIYLFDFELNLLDEISISNPASAFLIKERFCLFLFVGNKGLHWTLSPKGLLFCYWGNSSEVVSSC